MRCLVIFILLLSSSTFRAQLAPDFTVTDFDGTEIALYEDLLDEGKTVVLEFFFLDCVPCLDLSPNLELFYQDWGGGDDEVELLSISHEDDDPSISEYAATYGLTFPMIGSDGGGTEVYEEFSSGVYGEFLGHPTFVIIAPDGTMSFNPVEDDIEMLVSVNNVLEDVVEAGTVGLSELAKPTFEFVMSEPGTFSLNTDAAGLFTIHSIDGKELHSKRVSSGKTSVNLIFSGVAVTTFHTSSGVQSKVIYFQSK